MGDFPQIPQRNLDCLGSVFSAWLYPELGDGRGSCHQTAGFLRMIPQEAGGQGGPGTRGRQGALSDGLRFCLSPEGPVSRWIASPFSRSSS